MTFRRLPLRFNTFGPSLVSGEARWPPLVSPLVGPAQPSPWGFKKH